MVEPAAIATHDKAAGSAGSGAIGARASSGTGSDRGVKRPAPGPPAGPHPNRLKRGEEDCREELHVRLSELSLALCRIISVVLTCICIGTINDSSLVSCRIITVVLTCVYTASCPRVCSHEHT